ncbi:MAG: hypothetical protein WA924_08695 [Burkholderiaceae bacterium]
MLNDAPPLARERFRIKDGAIFCDLIFAANGILMDESGDDSIERTQAV